MCVYESHFKINELLNILKRNVREVILQQKLTLKKIMIQMEIPYFLKLSSTILFGFLVNLYYYDILPANGVSGSLHVPRKKNNRKQ